jgi:hypothetical protein
VPSGTGTGISGPGGPGATGSGGAGGISGTATGPGGPGATGGSAGAGADGELPYADWIFEEGRAPDNYPCYETTESWIPGEPTFLPGRDEL